jgi:hypothetical protein
VLQRTNKIFIGKDINRTAAVTDAIGSDHLTLSSHIAEGEIVVLDKFKRVLAAGSTIADTDVIYICQGTANTFNYQPESGSAVSSAVKIRISDPIEGNKVKSYSGKSYSAPAQQVSTFDLTGVTPVVGTEYVLRVVYKDIWEHPGQFTHTYRYVSTTATLATFLTAFVAKINSHKGRRIVASESASVNLILTGLAIPECTTSLNDLDKFTVVEFKPVLNYVCVAAVGSYPIGSWVPLGYTSYTLTTTASKGSGYWAEVRDMEREAWGYQGITNRTHFPVIVPDLATVKSSTYDIITIEHDASYLSPDNQYVKQAPLTTQIAFVVPSSGTQEQVVLSVLNTWFSSCPGSFVPVSV